MAGIFWTLFSSRGKATQRHDSRFSKSGNQVSINLFAKFINLRFILITITFIVLLIDFYTKFSKSLGTKLFLLDL